MSELLDMQPDDKTLLSMREVHKQLTERGIKISYDTLASFIGTDDIAEQLHVGGGQNRRTFSSGVVDILSDFWPRYVEVKGRLPQAANLLRSYLKPKERLESTGSGELVRLPPPEESAPSPIQIAEAQGRAEGLAATDMVMTATEAAEFLRTTVRTLRKHVRPSLRIGTGSAGDRWRRSDLLNLSK